MKYFTGLFFLHKVMTAMIDYALRAYSLLACVTVQSYRFVCVYWAYIALLPVLSGLNSNVISNIILRKLIWNHLTNRITTNGTCYFVCFAQHFVKTTFAEGVTTGQITRRHHCVAVDFKARIAFHVYDRVLNDLLRIIDYKKQTKTNLLISFLVMRKRTEIRNLHDFCYNFKSNYEIILIQREFFTEDIIKI